MVFLNLVECWWNWPSVKAVPAGSLWLWSLVDTLELTLTNSVNHIVCRDLSGAAMTTIEFGNINSCAAQSPSSDAAANLEKWRVAGEIGSTVSSYFGKREQDLKSNWHFSTIFKCNICLVP